MHSTNITLYNFINIIKWTLSNRCKGTVGRRIEDKINYICEKYGITRGEIIDDILFSFITHNHMDKYDETKGKATTFIPYYVNNYLNNLGRKYERNGMGGEFERYKDLADNQFRRDVCSEGLFRNNDDGESEYDFYSFLDYQGLTEDCYSGDDPEKILLAKETMALAVQVIGLEEVQFLIGLVDLEDRLNELGVSRATYYRRLKKRKQLFRELLDKINSE